MLITLFNAPKSQLRMTELAERVVLTPSGLTHLVSRLERQGLVEPHRRRIRSAQLLRDAHRAGHRRLRESRVTHNEVIRSHLTRRLSAKQLAALGSLWETIDASEPA